MKHQINASILSANFAHLGREVNDVMKAGADNIHFDVMDNNYVSNLTIGPLVLKSLRDDGITAGVDVHLMVDGVKNMIREFAVSGANSIVFHPEAVKHVDFNLQLIKSYGIQAGLALNPFTSIESLDYVADKIDRVLLMSVNPGFAGQKFIDKMYQKIQKVSEWIKKQDHNIILEVDGGISTENIAKAAKYGATAFVSGSAIFNSSNYRDTITSMRSKLIA